METVRATPEFVRRNGSVEEKQQQYPTQQDGGMMHATNNRGPPEQHHDSQYSSRKRPHPTERESSQGHYGRSAAKSRFQNEQHQRRGPHRQELRRAGRPNDSAHAGDYQGTNRIQPMERYKRQGGLPPSQQGLQRNVERRMENNGRPFRGNEQQRHGQGRPAPPPRQQNEHAYNNGPQQQGRDNNQRRMGSNGFGHRQQGPQQQMQHRPNIGTDINSMGGTNSSSSMRPPWESSGERRSSLNGPGIPPHWDANRRGSNGSDVVRRGSNGSDRPSPLSARSESDSSRSSFGSGRQGGSRSYQGQAGNYNREQMDSGSFQRSPSNSLTPRSDSSRGSWDRRIMDSMPRPPLLQSSKSDSPVSSQGKTLNWQPGPDAQQEKLNQLFSSASSRDGRFGARQAPPPPPPRNHSDQQQGRLDWNNNIGFDEDPRMNNNIVFRGSPEQKRPRISGLPMQRRDSALGQRWQPSNQQQGSQTQKEQNEQRNITALSAVSDVSKKKAFAGRFVPKSGTAESFDKLRAEKERNKGTNGNVNAVAKEGPNETAGAEDVSTRDGEVHDVTQTDSSRLQAEKSEESQRSESTDATQKCGVNDVEKVVMKLPEALEVGKHSLKDIVKDTITPELTEASAETDLKTSASYSSCSLHAHASVTPSVEVIESPHSLTHPDDATVESETGAEERKPAASVVIDLPVEELSERSKENELNDVNDSEKTDSPKETEAMDSVSKGTNTSAADNDAEVVDFAMKEPPAAEPRMIDNAMTTTESSLLPDTGEKDAPKEIEVTDAIVKEANASVTVDTVVDPAVKETPAAESSKKNNAAATTEAPLASDKVHSNSSDSDSSDEETDEEELQLWAQKMFGVPPPIAVRVQPAERAYTSSDSSEEDSDSDLESREERSSPRPHLTLHLKMLPAKVPAKRKRRGKAVLSPRKKGKGTRKVNATKVGKKKEEDEEMLGSEEAKRKKEEAKPLTAAEVRKILDQDKGCCGPSSHWVRRSMRQPSRSVLNQLGVRSLVEKLRVNDYDMVVLKMKKYCSDLDTPTMVIDAVLDALEENTNCQALYIQNFNEGMRDEQVLHLLRILQMPCCNIWCLNIGETYNVKTETWKLFTKGLKKTKITHMYASEHTISTSLKDEIRDTIRKNRSKHDMHCNPDNLDVIVQCTHCWWNPINTKALRPYLSKRGMEYILHDSEAQGLQGSKSLPAGDAGTAKNGDL